MICKEKIRVGMKEGKHPTIPAFTKECGTEMVNKKAIEIPTATKNVYSLLAEIYQCPSCRNIEIK